MKILLYKGISFESKMIKWYTGAEYSHAAILTSDGRVMEAWSNKIKKWSWKTFKENFPWSIFGNERGSVVIRKNTHEGHTPHTPVDVYEILDNPNEEEVIEFVRQCIDRGDEFDFLGMIGFILPFVKGRKRAWWCSELVTEAMRYGGVDLTPGDNKVTPGELAESDKLKKVGSFET